MLFGRRKPGYTTTVDSSVDPEQAVLDLQKAELAAKKKPKAEVFDINAASPGPAPGAGCCCGSPGACHGAGAAG